MKLCVRCKLHPAVRTGINYSYCRPCRIDIGRRSTKQGSDAYISKLADSYRPKTRREP
jgi:hypothetical protein